MKDIVVAMSRGAACNNDLNASAAESISVHELTGAIWKEMEGNPPR